MSEALSYPFNGTGIQLLEEFSSDSPPQAISAVTKANPPVVTSTGHGLIDGDVIKITGALGMTELNGKTFVVEVLSSSTFELLGVKAANYKTYTGGGSFDVGQFTDFCAVTSFSRQGGSRSEQDTSSVCTTDQKTFKLGLGDPGTTQVNLLFAPVTDPVQVRISELDGTNQLTAFRLAFKDDDGVVVGTSVLICFVQQTSEQGANDQRWTASVTFRNSGKRWDFLAA